MVQNSTSYASACMTPSALEALLYFYNSYLLEEQYLDGFFNNRCGPCTMHHFHQCTHLLGEGTKKWSMNHKEHEPYQSTHWDGTTGGSCTKPQSIHLTYKIGKWFLLKLLFSPYLSCMLYRLRLQDTDRKRRETKMQPSRAHQGHQSSCRYVFIHFLLIP